MKLRYDEDPLDMAEKIIVKVTRLRRTPKGFKEIGSLQSEWREPDPGIASEKYAEIWNWMFENCPKRNEAPNDRKLSDGGAGRGTCPACGKVEAVEAGAVTCGAVRCSAWFGDVGFIVLNARSQRMDLQSSLGPMAC